MLRVAELGAEYASAWDDWAASDDAAAWERVAGDGVLDAPR
jgi:hypothetical protein